MSLLSWLFKVKKEEDKPTAKESNSKTLEQLLELLTPFKRTAYLPDTQIQKKCWSADSKFGGYPYLRDVKDWPVCPNCFKHMQLFVQLNLEELPVNKEQGLIQLFYCTNTKADCEGNCEAFFPFSKSVVCRKIMVGNTCGMVQPDIEEIFEERKITDWEAVDDYPNPEELGTMGIEFSDDEYEILEHNETGMAVGGDKLFGWPHWVQSIEYPSDRTTGSQMDLLFQIDSEQNLPYMFGDCGIGHLTQSKDNPEELAFAWACY